MKNEEYLDEAEEMFQNHNGLCAICGTDTPGGRGGFHLDHDHATGRARGILCNLCNISLGRFKDDPELLAKAYGYLVAN